MFACEGLTGSAPESFAPSSPTVLTELGGYSPDNVRTLLDPGRDELLAALAEAEARISDHTQAGEQSVFLFYYSGHARAHALNMGEEELELPVLRERLTTLPATVTVARI